MLYSLYEAQRALLTPMRLLAKTAQTFTQSQNNPFSQAYLGRAVEAGAAMFEDLMEKRGKPEWGIEDTEVDGEVVGVEIEPVLRKGFGDLVRFRKPGIEDQPKVLLVAPMSGHYATLLRGTVRAMLPGHDVYITDWIDASQAPLSLGRFDLNIYLDYLMDFMRHLGPEVHVIAVCQPAPLVLAAVSVLSEIEPEAAPTSMTLMGGPVDTRANPTVPTELAEERSLAWFETRCITTVPGFYPGAFRRVYPGFLQLGAFIAMNLDRHVDAHMNMFRHLVVGDGDSAEAHRRFYNEYLAVMDVPAEYYLETVQGVFQEHWLPKGEFRWHGHPVRPAAITRTALMTVEGELDDISAPGQTVAAHALCPNIPKERREHYLQPGVGHYGIFNGRRWREKIAPRIAGFIRESAKTR